MALNRAITDVANICIRFSDMDRRELSDDARKVRTEELRHTRAAVWAMQDLRQAVDPRILPDGQCGANSTD